MSFSFSSPSKDTSTQDISAIRVHQFSKKKRRSPKKKKIQLTSNSDKGLKDQSLYKSFIMVKGRPTLNELSQLKQSGFGQPKPRHGLNLLYWFAHDYIEYSNGNIVSKYSPQDGDFGFHEYQNRIEDEEDDRLLPDQNLPYYEVGNLNYRGADQLPDYVRANYNHNTPDSNKDRIIVRLDANGSFNRVYVTEHSDTKRFDSSKTFRVSQGLLQIIKNMRQDQYLSQLSNFIFAEQCHYETAPEDKSSWWCAIL